MGVKLWWGEGRLTKGGGEGMEVERVGCCGGGGDKLCVVLGGGKNFSGK